MQLTYLVTGSSGFIGGHTVRHLLENGHKVVGLDNRIDSKQYNVPLEYHFHLRDVRNGITLDLFEWYEFDAVIHLAANASLQKSIKDPVYDAEHNIIGSLNIIHECAARDIKLVFASTSAVYAEKSKPIRETDECQPLCPYGLSKYTVEQYIQLLVPHYAILRYGNVYGPEQKPVGDNCLIPRAIDYINHGVDFQINGNGKNVRDFIHVLDVAKANRNFASATVPNGIFNISNGRGTSVNEIWKLLCEYSGHDPTNVKEGPANQGEMKKVVLDNESAQWHGFAPQVALETGLKETYLWASK